MTAGSTAGIEWLIQIQHLLKLNSKGILKVSRLRDIFKYNTC